MQESNYSDSLVPTIVSCVSKSVSQIKLLASRGTEQSEPAQLSEHTHTPRDYEKPNILLDISTILF